MACLVCCDDLEGCTTHQKPRAQALLKEQILAGTTATQTMAAAQRRRRIPDAGRFFKEPGFVYQGDTVVIWDLRAYAQNIKWREDAVRKSVRRQRANALHQDRNRPLLRTSRKRFHRLTQKWYSQAAPATSIANPVQPNSGKSFDASKSAHPLRPAHVTVSSGPPTQLQRSAFLSQSPKASTHAQGCSKSTLQVK